MLLAVYARWKRVTYVTSRQHNPGRTVLHSPKGAITNGKTERERMAELHVVGEIVGAAGFEDRNLFCKVRRHPPFSLRPRRPQDPPSSAPLRTPPTTKTF